MDRRDSFDCDSIEVEDLEEDPEAQLEEIAEFMAHIARCMENIKNDLNDQHVAEDDDENPTIASNGHDNSAAALQDEMDEIHSVERCLERETVRTSDLLQTQKSILKMLEELRNADVTTDERLNALKVQLIEVKSNLKSQMIEMGHLEICVLQRTYSSFEFMRTKLLEICAKRFERKEKNELLPMVELLKGDGWLNVLRIQQQKAVVRKLQADINGLKNDFRMLLNNSELALKKVEKLQGRCAGITEASSVDGAAGDVGDNTG